MTSQATGAPRRPAFQFYPSDWRTDPGLSLCSIPARGLWIEMLCIMHNGDPYGTLTVRGKPIDDRMLAKLVGESIEDVATWRSELADNGVYSTDQGVIISRRMVRDEAMRNARAAGGHLGAEHGQKGAEHGQKGAAHGKKGGRPRTRPATAKSETRPLGDDKTPPLPSNETRPPSSSSSSPSSTPVEEGSGLSGAALGYVGDRRDVFRANGGAA